MKPLKLLCLVALNLPNTPIYTPKHCFLSVLLCGLLVCRMSPQTISKRLFSRSIYSLLYTKSHRNPVKMRTLCALFVHETTPFCFYLYMAFKCPTMRFTCLVSKLSTTDIKAAYGLKNAVQRVRKEREFSPRSPIAIFSCFAACVPVESLVSFPY